MAKAPKSSGGAGDTALVKALADILDEQETGSRGALAR